MVRSFLAINLCPDANDAIQKAMEQWRVLGKRVKWVKPTNIHCTLKFLGDLTPLQLDRVSESLDIITKQTNPFNLELARPGIFPHLKRPRILWLGLKGDIERLQLFQDLIENDLADKGFEPETRPFIPHITVGRIKGRVPAKEKLEFFLKSTISAPISTIDKIQLYQSTLTPSGPIYKILSTHNFNKYANL